MGLDASESKPDPNAAVETKCVPSFARAFTEVINEDPTSLERRLGIEIKSWNIQYTIKASNQENAEELAGLLTGGEMTDDFKDAMDTVTGGLGKFDTGGAHVIEAPQEPQEPE